MFGKVVPCGKPGELWTRGYLVMLGYVGDNDATKQVIPLLLVLRHL